MAYLMLNEIDLRVFQFLMGRVQMVKIRNGKYKGNLEYTNNGKIEIANSTIMKSIPHFWKGKWKVGIAKGTCTNAVHKLIEVGLIKLTRIGNNKLSHMYEILYSTGDVINMKPHQERWRRYPKENWKHECPKFPNNLVGVDTRFKSKENKHHPKTLNSDKDNHPKELGHDLTISSKPWGD